MSGFLSRLAERAVGASRLVEPRLRSRFEPDAQFTVASPMEVEEFLDVPPADIARPGAEHRAPTAPAGNRAATVDRGAPAPLGTTRQPVPATQQARGSAPLPAAQEDVADETVSTRVEPGVESVFPPGAQESEPAPARPPADMGGATHAPQLAPRAGADHVAARRQPLAADPDARPTPIATNYAKSDAVTQEAGMDHTTVFERPVTETELEWDDPVFAADTSINGSRSLDSAAPADEVRAAMEPSMERAAERATPVASTHVRSVKTSRHEARRPTTPANDHDFGPMDRAAIDVERGSRRMDRAESMRLDHLADSEAVVQVRIGRIDVRAAAPPPPAIQRSTQPRVESLDDYLKRTSGRR
ncbi:MAG TPA: hypothetical protein VN906_09255 [Candidatus Sulfotelmatobacter sp.]|nr:hypothetical protein [Candidatus Sulfotelmatobacter sp.]